jgi:adenosine deaminase
MDRTSENFIAALESKDLEGVKKIDKSDLHNHSGRGGNIAFLAPEVIPPIEPFDSLAEMQEWFDNNIKPICSGKDGGWLRRIEAAFRQAREDNIKILSLNFGIENIDLLGGMDPFIQAIDNLCKEQSPDTLFFPELGIGFYQNVDEILNKLDHILSYNYFKSIDLNSGEDRALIHKFIPVYRKAKAAGLILKAHVGEFGSAEDVKHAVEMLELDEIHHGIAAANSKYVMRFLADNHIRLNVCPTSNYMLKTCSSLDKHPIRELYDNGVPVTVNTDDLLIFNSSVSEEFMKLYDCGLMKANELDEIRLCGLAYGHGRT